MEASNARRDRRCPWLAGELVITGGGIGDSTPADVRLAVSTEGELLIQIAETTTWRLRLDAGELAYLAGWLAIASGVTFE